MFTKPFVCVALACVGLSHGVRRDFKVDRPASVVEGVSALIQKHAAPVAVQSAMQILETAKKAVQGITPGAKEAMDKALEDVINNITDKVQSKIKQDHKDTQQAIETRLDDLRTATNAVVEAKKSADSADNAWVKCRGVEKTKLQGLEDAQAALAAAREAKVAPCAEQDAAAPYSKEFVEEALTFECDISKTGNCDGPLAAFNKEVDGVLSDLKKDVSAKTKIFNDAKGRCSAAKAAIEAAETAVGKAKEVFQSQKEDCLRDHESRQMSICAFGMDLTSKCTARKGFEVILNGKIDGSGDTDGDGASSESDRKAEWEASTVTKCMLNLIVVSKDLATVNLNEDSLAKCHAAVNYARDVGVLDRKKDEFAALITPEKFTCGEREITFSGFTWTVPATTPKLVVTADQYQKKASTVPINVASEAKFEFCAVEAQTCGDFYCEFGKNLDSGKTCKLSSGCTAGECCA